MVIEGFSYAQQALRVTQDSTSQFLSIGVCDVVADLCVEFGNICGSAGEEDRIAFRSTTSRLVI